MNKQNSMGVDNSLSTEINQSTKSYSSRFKQLKAIKSQPKSRHAEVLPFRREKAAAVIQRFWRLRTIIRKRLYEQMIEELETGNRILEFQNSNLDRMISICRKDCQQFQSYFQASGHAAAEQTERQANEMIKQMAIMTFKLDKKMANEEEMARLLQRQAEGKAQLKQLSCEREQLKEKLSGELQAEEQEFLRKIKEENSNLLRVSRQKNEMEKMMREKQIEACKNELMI